MQQLATACGCKCGAHHRPAAARDKCVVAYPLVQGTDGYTHHFATHIAPVSLYAQAALSFGVCRCLTYGAPPQRPARGQRHS
eukprot:scaffold174779_cov39-Tisochrysis_lutea.AAC.1